MECFSEPELKGYTDLLAFPVGRTGCVFSGRNGAELEVLVVFVDQDEGTKSVQDSSTTERFLAVTEVMIVRFGV
jgi:hypothetical protein